MNKGSYENEASPLYKICFCRNYNSPVEEILELSEWSSDIDYIMKYFKNNKFTGGWVEEALEVGLWHANTEK